MIPVTLIVTVLKELVSLRYGVADFWAHAFLSTSLVGAILFSPVAGLLIDRISRRGLLVSLALVGNGLCFFAMAMAPTFAVLMLARFIEGALHITALSAWLATAASQSPEGRSGRIMGAMGGMLMLGITIGVPLGGIIAKWDPNLVLWAAGWISLLGGLLALVFIRGRYHGREHISIAEFAGMVRNHPWLAIPYAYAFIDRLCIGVVVSSMGLYMSDVLGLSPAQRGMELSYFLVVFAALSYPAGRLSDRMGRAIPIAVGSILFGLVFMSYGYLSEATLMLGMVASGVFSAIMFSPTLALCKDLSGDTSHGTAFSGYNVAGSLGFVVGPLLGGSLFAWFQTSHSTLEAYRQTFFLTGSFEILIALITLPLLMKLKRQGRVR
ncbi:MAG: MFS transporter [Calditrichaeota bacterium]|nr:MFS transporter [Calditrichota bacterium]